MNTYQAIILGLIQGLTEFLPVSSSGHLVIAQALLPNFTSPGILFDLWLHLATLAAVLIYFRSDVERLLLSISPLPSHRALDLHLERKLAGLIILGSVPTAVIGFVFKDQLEGMFENALPVAVMLLVTGLLLWLADRMMHHSGRDIDKMGIWDALLIGTVQGLAIIPGISRSGSTIATGIYCKLDRELSARYSFLLAIPAIMGAALLQAKEWSQLCNSVKVFPLLVGAGCAAITGYLAIDVLMRVVVKQKLRYFAYYCWAVGIISIIALSI